MDYNEKAEMIINGTAVTLDDGKIVMLSAKHFNEFYTPAIAKQIPSPVKYTTIFNEKYYNCQTCGTFGRLHYVRPLYCSFCGQTLLFEEENDE